MLQILSTQSFERYFLSLSSLTSSYSASTTSSFFSDPDSAFPSVPCPLAPPAFACCYL